MKDGIYIAAPPAQPWQVSVEDVESWFRERWPDAVIDREHDSLTGQGSLTGQDCLDFEVILGGRAAPRQLPRPGSADAARRLPGVLGGVHRLVP